MRAGARDGREGDAHAQAVRFLTTLRSDDGGHVNLSDEHRNFLREKGFDDAAIERARQAAERPDVAAGNAPALQNNVAGADANAFDRAAQSFNASPDSDAAAPAVPPASYPRSPLALYSEPNDAQDAGAILTRLAAAMNQPHYDVLVRFFRALNFMMLLGGTMTAIATALYRVRVPCEALLISEICDPAHG